MQRLFSTFPNSWPGLGLLILRLAAGFSLVADSVSVTTLPETITGVAALGLTLVAAVSLGLGFLTPYAAAMAAIIRITEYLGEMPGLGATVVAVSFCVGLGMIGPGAWSIDARVFGRKRITLAGRPDE